MDTDPSQQMFCLSNCNTGWLIRLSQASGISLR